ncbi:MAG: hypothetical protein WBE58_12290, partial [Verrucomicrobiales bacterium]
DRLGLVGGLGIGGPAWPAPPNIVPHFGPSLGAKILAIYVTRTSNALNPGLTGLGILGNAMKSEFKLQDDLDEMVPLMGDDDVDTFYFGYVRRDSAKFPDAFGGEWKKITFPKFNAPKAVSGSSVVVSMGNSHNPAETGWWLHSATDVNTLGGHAEMKCSGGKLMIRYRQVNWNWRDDIDARYNPPGDNLESFVNQYVEPVLKNDFWVDIRFKDKRPSEVKEK